MKTKKVSKERKQIRKLKVEPELREEFGKILSNDFLDEDAFAMANCDDDYYYE